MTEIDYGRLDALEGILGGRAAINDAYLKGKSYGAPDSVAIVSSANVFTAAQTFNVSGVQATFQNGSAANVARINNIASAANVAGNIDLYGTNGLSPTKQAWYIAVDTSATTPYRDFALGKYTASGASDPDGIYISNAGTSPSTIGIGTSQPGDSGASYRLKLQSGATTMGGLQIRQFTSQTAHMLGLVDSGGTTEHVWVDPSNANTWLTVLTGDTSVGNPVLRIVDVTTNSTITFEAQATGTLHLKNPGANSINFQIGNSNQTAQINVLTTGEMNLGNLSAPNVIAIGNHNTSWTSLGFFGTSAVVKQSVTGALSTVTDAAAKAVLTSIIAALTNYGLTTNSTT